MDGLDTPPRRGRNEEQQGHYTLKMPPSTGQFSSNKHEPTVTTNRQKRLLSALFKYGRASTKQLRDEVGALNIPEIVAQLRKRGWMIFCSLIEVTDRDGKICRPGLYWLAPKHVKLAAKYIDEN